MNVPISEEPLGDNADDIWQRHESKIRRLYQTKGLKEVMTFMESTPGFPKLKPKTLIEKLGNVGIRKTVKNEEWAKIYQHIARYRLKDPTPVRDGNRGGNGVEKTNGKKGDKRWKKMIKDTEVMLGNKKIEWEEVWRNLRRAGAIVDLQPDPPSPLPADIIVQTPRSEPSLQGPHSPFNISGPRDGSITTMQSQELSLAPERSTLPNGIAYLDGGQGFIQQSLLQTSSANNPVPSTCLALWECIKAQMMLHLPSLPIWAFSNTFVQMMNLDLSPGRSAFNPGYDVSLSLAPNSKLLATPTMLLGHEVSDDSVFDSSDLLSSLIITQSSAAPAMFIGQQRAYIVLAVAIYILSNNLVDMDHLDISVHRGLFETLDSIFSEIPSRQLQALLQSGLHTVRAAFEALLKIAGILEQRVVFKSLVEFGISKDWLPSSAYGHELLYHAVCMDLYDVVQQLVEKGCRAEGQADQASVQLKLRSEGEATAIIKALERHNSQCLQLLLKYCDVNRKYFFGNCSCTNFTFFIEHTRHLDEMRICQGIELFLDAGADINSPLKTYATSGGWNSRDSVIWSALDYLFCFHPRLFYKLIPNWNPAQDSHPTRAGILTTLKLGLNALHGYCTRLERTFGPAYLDQYLELVLAEQLTATVPWEGLGREVDLKTVGALVAFGVSMDGILTRAPHLLAHYMEGRSDCDLDVIQYILDNRATVDDQALQHAVGLQNTGLLALLIRNIPNIRRQGLRAFVEAATASNFEAVKMLIDAGVNVNAEFHIDTTDRVSLLGHVIALWDSSFEDLRNMIDFLVQRGAHFRLSSSRPHLSDLLWHVISDFYYYDNKKGLRKRIAQHIIDKGCDLSDPETHSPRLLERCAYAGEGDDEEDRMEIFESMIRNGALLKPGAPLAAWISLGGGANLANQMLCGDVEIDAYYIHRRGSGVGTALQAAAARCDKELVVLLLQSGANVNAPARGRWGRTALQAICAFNPQSPAEKAQQIEIINLLVTRNADVNAAPARRGGMTALQFAVQHGNLEVVVLLLACNPPADVNAPPCQFDDRLRPYGNAVYLAAAHGRLDVVKLLLINGGLSSCSGETGYDGAIRHAEQRGFLAVAELIQQHATDTSRSSTTCAGLSQTQRDWHEYGYDDYSDGYTTGTFEVWDSEWEDTVSAAPSEEQDSIPQAQVQPSADETPAGPEHAAPEPGRAWEEQDGNSLNFDISFDNLAGDIDTVATGYGFDEWHVTGPTSIEELEMSDVYDADVEL